MAPSFKSENISLNVSIPLIVVSAVTFLVFAQYVFNVVKQYLRLSHIPGPFGSGWSRLFIIHSTYKNTLHLDFAAAIKKYGPLVRVSPNTLITNDPELVRRVNAVRSPYRKSTWYEMTDFTPNRHHIFSETNEERHALLRSQMAQGYSGKELGNSYLEECIDARLLDLFELIKHKYTSSANILKPVDFGRVSQYFVIDVITDIAFRKPFGFLKADADVNGYISTQEMLLPVFEWLSAIPILSKIAKSRWIAPYVMPKSTDKEGLGYMMGIAKNTVNQRFGTGKIVQNDMLGSFIKHGLDQKQAELEAALQVIVGTDTTVTSLRTVTMYVITHPQVYSKLQAELDAATLSNPIVTDNEARELPYLQACIKEGMRVFPPVTGLFNKRVPNEGDVIHGKFIPGGTDIAYSAWDFYKDSNIFGADSEVFRPERWLEASPEQLATMQKTIDLIFGYGKYSCLGKPIALLELGKALTEIFRRYDIELVDPFRPWKCYNRNGFFFQTEMWVRMTERRKSS